jgi:hypothetical protein
MESMFNLVLDEEEEAIPSAYSSRPSSKQNVSEAFSPSTSTIWSKSQSSMDKSWIPHSPASQPGIDAQPKEDNPLSRFFGGSIPNANQPSVPLQQSSKYLQTVSSYH